MFEGQYDSSSLTGKTWTGTTLNGNAGWVEGSGQDKPMHFLIQNTPQKSIRSSKILHSHPGMKDMVEGNNSPSINTWPMAPQKDDTPHSFNNNSSGQRDESSGVCEKGTQTTMMDDEATPQSVSSSTQYSWLDHLAVIESELASCPSGYTTKVEDASLPLNEEDSARMIVLEVQIQQLKEYDIPALRKELQDANIGLSKWEQRALAAERKARLFQKFTTRVRRLHSSLMTESSRQSGDDESAIKEESDAEGSYLVHSVRFNKVHEANQRGHRVIARKKSTDVEDGDVIASKISESLYPQMSAREGSLYDDSKTVTTGDGLLLHGMDGVASPKDDEEIIKFRNASVELWMAVQELLRMEYEEVSLPSQQSSGFAENGSSSEHLYL